MSSSMKITADSITLTRGQEEERGLESENDPNKPSESSQCSHEKTYCDQTPSELDEWKYQFVKGESRILVTVKSLESCGFAVASRIPPCYGIEMTAFYKPKSDEEKWVMDMLSNSHNGNTVLDSCETEVKLTSIFAHITEPVQVTDEKHMVQSLHVGCVTPSGPIPCFSNEEKGQLVLSDGTEYEASISTVHLKDSCTLVPKGKHQMAKIMVRHVKLDESKLKNLQFVSKELKLSCSIIGSPLSVYNKNEKYKLHSIPHTCLLNVSVEM